MNPTQKQDNHGPDHPSRLRDIIGRSTGWDIFRAGLATGSALAAQPEKTSLGTAAPVEPVPGPTHSPLLGLPMTDADRRRYALREAGYTGWIDADGYARTDAEATAWDRLMRGLRNGYLPGVGGGWVLTEAGRRSFAELTTAEQFDVAKALSEGVHPDQLTDADWDGEPLCEWLSDQDVDDAEGYGERLAERCLVQQEAADVRDMQHVRWLVTDHGRRALAAAEQRTTPVDGRCLRCDAPGGYPYCQRSVNGLWSCADLAGIDEAADDHTPGGPPDGETADTTVGLVLRLAAKYLQLHGWIQGAYYDGTTGVFTPPADMVGAIAMVCYGGPCEAPAQHFDDPGFLDFEEAVLHLDRFLLVEDGSEAYEFNDAHGRTAADVTRVLREAASRPAEELVDALQAMSDGHTLDKWLADRAVLLTPKITLNPNAVAACPCCGSLDRALRIEDAGFGPCGHYWHDGGSDGGDA